MRLTKWTAILDTYSTKFTVIHYINGIYTSIVSAFRSIESRWALA